MKSEKKEKFKVVLLLIIVVIAFYGSIDYLSQMLNIENDVKIAVSR